MDVIESLQRKAEELGEDGEEMSDGINGMDEKHDVFTGDKEIDDKSCEIQEDSVENQGMDVKSDAIAADESTEIHDDSGKDEPGTLVEAKFEMDNNWQKGTPKKAGGMNVSADANDLKGDDPEKNKRQTSPEDSTPKRTNKRKKPSGLSNSSPSSMLNSGVRTRSMKAKLAAAAQNDSPSGRLEVQGDDDSE